MNSFLLSLSSFQPLAGLLAIRESIPFFLSLFFCGFEVCFCLLLRTIVLWLLVWCGFCCCCCCFKEVESSPQPWLGIASYPLCSALSSFFAAIFSLASRQKRKRERERAHSTLRNCNFSFLPVSLLRGWLNPLFLALSLTESKRLIEKWKEGEEREREKERKGVGCSMGESLY